MMHSSRLLVLTLPIRFLYTVANHELYKDWQPPCLILLHRNCSCRQNWPLLAIIKRPTSIT
jgi:hypothetical protein